MAYLASVILLLMLTILNFPRYQSAVTIHELAKRQTKPEDVPNKKLYYFDHTDDDFREEVGELVNPGTKNEKLLVKGTYMFFENGKKYIVTYTADENGYVPEFALIDLDKRTRVIEKFVPFRSSTEIPEPYIATTVLPTKAINPILLKNLASESDNKMKD